MTRSPRPSKYLTFYFSDDGGAACGLDHLVAHGKPGGVGREKQEVVERVPPNDSLRMNVAT